MNRLIQFILTGIALGAASVGAYWFFAGNQHAGKTSYAMLQSAMIDSVSIIAAEKKMWPSDQIDVNVHKFPTGIGSVRAILSGQADFATLAGWPFILASSRDPSLRIVATTTQAYSLGIVVNSAKGVNHINDLKGRKIGVSFGTTGQYVLQSFLQSKGLSPIDYEPVALKPQEILAAFDRGDVDAISTWQPFLRFARNKLGNSAHILPESQKYLKVNFLLVAKEEFLKANPDKVRAVLSGLVSSAKFIADNKAEAIASLAKISGMKQVDIEELWPLFEFEISIDDELLDALERQQAWGIETGKLKTKTNWKDRVYRLPLAELAPELISQN